MIRSLTTVGAVVWLCLGPGIPSAQGGDVPSFSVLLDRDRVYVDEQVTLEIILSHPGDGRACAVGGPVFPPIEGLRIGSRSTLTETHWEASGDRTEIRHRLVLIPEKAGTVSLDSILVSWAAPSDPELKTRVLNAGTLQIRERPPVIGTLVRYPQRTLAGAGLLVVGIAVLVWLWRRRKPADIQTDLSPEEILEEDWRHLRVLARRGSLGPFSEEASRAVRNFVKNAFGIPGVHLPTAAITDALENAGASSTVVSAVQKTLTFVDDMKFGLWVPTHAELETILGEIEQIWSSSRRGDRATGRRGET